jgi:hypothetical protein
MRSVYLINGQTEGRGSRENPASKYLSFGSQRIAAHAQGAVH